MHTKYFLSISIACRRSSSSLFVLSLALFTANLLHFNAMDEVKTLCSDHDERDSNEVRIKKFEKRERSVSDENMKQKNVSEKLVNSLIFFLLLIDFLCNADRFIARPSKGFTRRICFYFTQKWIERNIESICTRTTREIITNSDF